LTSLTDPPIQTSEASDLAGGHGRFEDFDVTSYPDYRASDLPPDVYKLRDFSFLDEYESVWGQQWGCPGIGTLRKVALVRPSAHEINELFTSHPTFFLLRYQSKVDVDEMIASHKAYADLLTEHGVEIEWMEFENAWGAHGPMRKLFVCEEVRVVRGGAIIPRFGHASYKRGLEREFQRFLAGLGCPILLSVSGSGVCEVAPMFVAMAEDAWIGGRSCAANQDGLDQVIPVMQRAGAKDIHIMNLNTIHDTFDAGGEFHVDMVVAPVDNRVAVIYPDQLDWDTYVWLRDRNFKLIEIPREEQRFAPANLILLEPGKVIMTSHAPKTIKAVEAAGVEVIPFDSHGIMQGGTNGIKCITMELLRDPGPGLDD
jgi:N-dimethylarginine dimethylaminohydrolase